MNSLSKGLVFYAPLDERSGTQDLVSEVVGTPTAVYPVLDKSGSGRRWLEYNGTSSYSSFTAIAAFSTANFMVTGKIKTGALGAIRTILGGAANSFEINVSATGYLTARKVGSAALTSSTTLLSASTEYTFAYVRSSTTGTYYINGVVAGTTTDANDYTVGCTLIGNATGFYNGSVFMARAFNFAGTSTQAINYQKAEYPIEYTHRGAGATKCILDFNAEGMSSSTLIDKINSITATNSGTVYNCPAASNLKASNFNGSTSNAAFINSPGLTGDITIAVTYNPFSGGENDLGTLINNSKIFLVYVGSQDKWATSRNGSTLKYSNEALVINQWKTMIMTSTSAGLTTFYINNAISGATETAGTPVSGSDIYIGNALANNRTFNGLIKNVAIWSRILTADEITLLNAIN